MLILYYLFLSKPALLIIPYVLQVVPYFFLLKKMELNKLTCIIPFIADYKFSRKVFPKRRTFFRSLIYAAVFVCLALYLGPNKGLGLLYTMIAFVAYSVFLVRLYWRIGKAYNKNVLYRFGMILLPFIFLTILAFSKAEYTQPYFKPEKPHSTPVRVLKRIGFVTVSVVEVIALTIGASFVAVLKRTPSFIIEANLEDYYKQVDNLQVDGTIVTRADTLGESCDAVVAANKGRDYYFADHSNDKEVTVFTYIIGSNLEDENGSASLNIHQMEEATKQGSNLKFIIEAGGSDRWFTDGIDSKSVGRYEISNGEIKEIEALDSKTNMATEESLTDFVTWAAENYSSDRNMLVMWDHGSGIGYGYGIDELNGKSSQTISVSSIVNAISQANMKFDMIGFDACLMQDIELANALEPYADYFMASEESELAIGWYYADAFGALAQDPTMSTVDFGEKLLAGYDSCNKTFNDGEAVTTSTLSMIDLTQIKSAMSQLNAFWKAAAKIIKTTPESFADLSLAAQNAYDFSGMQMDVIGFLKSVDVTDTKNLISTHEEKEALIQSLEAAVVARNGDSAQGIYGLAFAFPYQAMSNYTPTRKELKAFSLKSEIKAFDEIFSIIAAQKHKSSESMDFSFDLASGNLANTIIQMANEAADYTQEEWYIKGFEDYDDVEQLVDIPLTQVENGYQIQLPEETWEVITDVQTMVYQKVDDDTAATRYIGNDYIGDTDANGHNLVAVDDHWVYVGGQIVCYEADQVAITDQGYVYRGYIRAQLNGTEDVYLVVEWDPITEGQPETAHILGYQQSTQVDSLEEKGYTKLEAGDTLEFLFDYYDEEGNLVDTRTAGDKVRVTDQASLSVIDSKMDACTIEFGGVLKDIYQRNMTTEMIEMDIQ